MTRVLLTGASGFVANHVLDALLAHGHSVRITVRSVDKAEKLIAAHPEHKDKIDYAIVKDIAQLGAFDEAVKSDPPFEAVIHTASPFHFNVTDVQKDLLDPAVNGTLSILQAVKAYAPTVKRVVVTSSFAAIMNGPMGNWPDHVYTEADWNPITKEEGLENASNGYRASKVLAEQAAWDFVKNEKPNFDVTVMNPPLVIGPVKPYGPDIAHINTSNERTSNILQGKTKEALEETGVYIWVDVRDLAEGHVKAIEVPEAGGKRFLMTAGNYSNQQIADVIVKNFPEYKDNVPKQREAHDGFPAEGIYKADNSRSREILGIKYRSLEESVVDLVKSLKEKGL